MEDIFVASLLIGNSDTYISVLERTVDGYALHYVKKLDNTIILTNAVPEKLDAAIAELTTILSPYKSKLAKFFVTIDDEYYHLTQVPGSIDILNPEFVDLINLEIRQTTTEHSIDNYRIKATPIENKKDNEGASEMPMCLVCLINNDIVWEIEYLATNLELELTDINPVPFSSINTFTYNYPDKKDSAVAIVCLKQNVIEYGILQNNSIIGYEFSKVNGLSTYSGVIENKIDNIIESYQISNLSGAYFYGSSITKQQYIECWEVGMIMSGDSKRLNPYRLVKSKLDKRDEEYCARTFHIYVACIGGALPTMFQTFVR
jgi:hypothetical protein